MSTLTKPIGASVATPAVSRTQQMLHGPLLPTLLRLATPNVIGLFAMTVVIGYDGYILGRLGADALAGIALVFPLSMLMMQMSGGGIGGAVTAAVARALGAGRAEEAGRLAQQSLIIACVLAAAFTAVLLGFGGNIFAAMGGRGASLDAALAYSNVLYGGAIVIWSTNVLGAAARGAGNMLLPALMLVLTALIHLVLCPTLVFGWGPIPGLGVAGAAVSMLVANGAAAVALAAHLLRRDAAAPLNRSPWRLHAALLRDILRVGVPASMSPVVSNASIAVATAYVGTFGTDALAGYGVAASDGVLRCTIPNGTVIPARGHFLCVNSVGYSLGSYPAATTPSSSAGTDNYRAPTATGADAPTGKSRLIAKAARASVQRGVRSPGGTVAGASAPPAAAGRADRSRCRAVYPARRGRRPRAPAGGGAMAGGEPARPRVHRVEARSVRRRRQVGRDQIRLQDAGAVNLVSLNPPVSLRTRADRTVGGASAHRLTPCGSAPSSPRQGSSMQGIAWE